MIEAAIVGMGRWGQTLVDSVQSRNDAGIRFIAGSTGRPERAAEWAARQGVKILPDLAAILAEPRVKAVVIASPHQMHADQVIAAARAGNVEELIAVVVARPLCARRFGPPDGWRNGAMSVCRI